MPCDNFILLFNVFTYLFQFGLFCVDYFKIRTDSLIAKINQDTPIVLFLDKKPPVEHWSNCTTAE